MSGAPPARRDPAQHEGAPSLAAARPPAFVTRRLCLLAGAALPATLLPACAATTGHDAGPAGDAARLQAALRTQPLVLLGEVHDNPVQHALRADALRRRLQDGARPALLMEQFDREQQAAIDRVLARPGADADAVIAAAWPQGGAGWAWPLYRPFITLALQYRLRLVAANVSRADTRRVIAGGLAAAGFEPEVPADIAAAQAAAIVASHCGQVDDALARKLMLAQVARDQFMARQLVAHAQGGAVLLAGNGHVRRDIGVPRWLPAPWQPRSIAIGLLEPGEAPAGAYDLALTTAATERPDPCAGMPPMRAASR